MKKQQVDHVLRAAGRITGERQFIIIGSQSLHGKYPDLPDEILTSFEVDLIASKTADRTEWLNVIGIDSPFHETFGYYADPVDASTATLPRGWKGRLVSLPPGETEGVKGLCLEPHDLAIAKYAAARDKDLIFTRSTEKCVSECAARSPEIFTRRRRFTYLRGSTRSGEGANQPGRGLWRGTTQRRTPPTTVTTIPTDSTARSLLQGNQAKASSSDWVKAGAARRSFVSSVTRRAPST